MDETEASVWDLCLALRHLFEQQQQDVLPMTDRALALRRIVMERYRDMMSAEVINLVDDDDDMVIVEEMQPRVRELRDRPNWQQFFPQVDDFTPEELALGFVIKQRFDVRNDVLKELTVRLANWAAAPQGVEIRRSTIPQAGHGLFATRDFPRRRMTVTAYGGLTSNENASDGLAPTEQSPYVIQYDRWHYVDAERFFHLDECGRWINGDPRRRNVGFIGSENEETNSVLFDVETLRPVQAGDEFFLDYGPNYRV